MTTKSKWHRTCELTVTGEIQLNPIALSKQRNEVLPTYGHEQRHILSAISRLEAKKEDWQNRADAVFDSEAECKKSLDGLNAIDKVIQKECDNLLNNTPDHSQDKTATGESPEANKGYDPLPDSPEIPPAPDKYRDKKPSAVKPEKTKPKNL